MAVTTVKLSIRDWAKYSRGLAQNFKPTLTRGLMLGAQRALTVIQRAVVDAGAHDTGGYRRMWKKRTIANGSGTTGVMFYNQHPAAAVIEHGRRAGRKPPPSQVLVPWMKRKLGMTLKEAQALAFVFARAIGRRGQKARNVLKGAEPEMRQVIEDEIQHELLAALTRGPL